MSIDYNTPIHELPKELRDKIEKANVSVAQKLYERLVKPVPGNPYGGFPGINVAEHKKTLLDTHRSLIDKWNADNG